MPELFEAHWLIAGKLSALLPISCYLETPTDLYDSSTILEANSFLYLHYLSMTLNFSYNPTIKLYSYHLSVIPACFCDPHRPIWWKYFPVTPRPFHSSIILWKFFGFQDPSSWTLRQVSFTQLVFFWLALVTTISPYWPGTSMVQVLKSVFFDMQECNSKLFMLALGTSEYLKTN